MLNTLHMLSHLILSHTLIIVENHCHFTDRKPDAQKDERHAKVHIVNTW